MEKANARHHSEKKNGRSSTEISQLPMQLIRVLSFSVPWLRISSAHHHSLLLQNTLPSHSLWRNGTVKPLIHWKITQVSTARRILAFCQNSESFLAVTTSPQGWDRDNCHIMQLMSGILTSGDFWWVRLVDIDVMFLFVKLHRECEWKDRLFP